MPTILKIAISAPLYHYFDYLVPGGIRLNQLKKGLRVLVPFGRQEKIGFLVEVTDVSSLPLSQLRVAIALLDEVPLLPDTLLSLLEWTSRYYHYPLGEVFASALPRLLRVRKRLKEERLIGGAIKDQVSLASGLLTPSFLDTRKDSNLSDFIQLNAHQQAAVDTLVKSLGQFSPFLLNGVTGSGKTEVYLEVIQAVLHRGEQVLLLVPEIGLAPQMVDRFQIRFPNQWVLLHSQLTDRQRFEHWWLAKTGKAAIVIGTRSTLFTPLLRPGLIIIDEEHDASFKQSNGLRYHARDLALVRARLENIPVILGSATASLESLWNVRQRRYHALYLPKRAGGASQPKFCIIDLRGQKLDQGFSATLLQVIGQHLKNQRQVLLFLNRRGFAPVTICRNCGWTADCQYCERKMVLHKKLAYLQCHYCAYRQPLILNCPVCQSSPLFFLGQGTQRLEQTLQHHFPGVDMVRIDRDSTRRKGSWDGLLKDIRQGKSQILIGTQMLAKGHHFPNVSLVGILEADSGLFSPDFRALERTAQLLMQVTGRAGRADKPGEVLVQTYHPEHPLLLHLLHQGYLSVGELLLKERRSSGLPPYSYLALLHAEARISTYPMDFLNEVKQQADQRCRKEVTLLGPIPSLFPRRAGYYRSQLLLQSTDRNALHRLLGELIESISDLASTHRVRWFLDIDPIELV